MMRLSIEKMISKLITKLHVVSRQDLRLLQTVKRNLLPEEYEASEHYVPQRKIGNAGFSLHVDRQLSLIRSLEGSDFQSMFSLLRNHKEINSGLDAPGDGKLIRNGYYPTPDAEIYAGMISLAKPDRIVEVGSGYSTLIARTTIDHIGLNCHIHVIDPEPRRDIESIADQIEYTPVERSSLGDMKLTKSTLLFIDSSHVCRTDGDLPFLFCRILPTLPAGVLVHVHDVFTPFDYPDNYFERFYNEQYLLQALLAHSTKFEVVLSTHYLTREHPSAMQAAFGPLVGRDPLYFGASFWMRSTVA